MVTLIFVLQAQNHREFIQTGSTCFRQPGSVFTKLFRFRIRLKFQNEYFLDYYQLFVLENLICVYIDMINVVLDLKCIRLKNMLETINYNKVNPVI